jgi:hypothetical protein
MDELDRESREALQAVAASEAGLPVGLSSRVAGTTISQMREDARRLALDTGYAEAAQPQARDRAGRFASTSGHQDFNNAIRQAFGHAVVADEPQQRPVGDLGVGVGGGARPRERARPTMNQIIRNAAAATHGVIPIERLAQEGPL